MKINVGACARCGQDHERLEFVPFSRAPDGATHWAKCPNACDPILLDIRTECCGCRQACDGSCPESEIVRVARQRVLGLLQEGETDNTWAWVLRVAIQEGEKAERKRHRTQISSHLDLCRCGHSRAVHAGGDGICTILTCPRCRAFEQGEVWAHLDAACDKCGHPVSTDATGVSA